LLGHPRSTRCTARRWTSTTNSTYSRVSPMVSTVKKSVAAGRWPGRVGLRPARPAPPRCGSDPVATQDPSYRGRRHPNAEVAALPRRPSGNPSGGSPAPAVPPGRRPVRPDRAGHDRSADRSTGGRLAPGATGSTVEGITRNAAHRSRGNIFANAASSIRSAGGTADAVPGGAAPPTGAEVRRSPRRRRSVSDRSRAHPEPAERSSKRSYEVPHHRACRAHVPADQRRHPDVAPHTPPSPEWKGCARLSTARFTRWLCPTCQRMKKFC